MAELLAKQARLCADAGSPFYAALLTRIADDVRADGPSAAVLAGHEDDPESAAVALRLMGTVHRIVLAGDAPGLAAHYPSVGGDGDADAAWPLIRRLFQSDPLTVAAGLVHPPQTNEVGRAAALVGALAIVLEDNPLPVRLWEIGCSGGLNLRADHFRYRDGTGAVWGPMSPVELDPAWTTAPTASRVWLPIVERVGIDIAPVDPTSDDGAQRLASYVWADQTDRLRRLRSAILVAREYPARIVPGRAADVLADLAPAEDAVTVLWHSVMWQYVPADEQQQILERIAAIGRAATATSPFVHIALEPHATDGTEDYEYLVTAQAWPGGEGRVLGRAAPHGIPVTWAV